MKYEISMIANCLPSYFSGSKKPVIQVPMYKDTTYGDIQQNMLNNDDIWAYDGSVYPGQVQYYADLFKEAVEEYFDGIDLNAVTALSKYIEQPPEDDGETAYSYFTVELID